MMPQYLAIDYLNDALCRKQATLSRMIIACPPHVLKSNDQSHNFAYREPWLKGTSRITLEKMHSGIEKDLDDLIGATSFSESQFLKFGRSEYHLSCNKIEEIIPSSESNSESEHYNAKSSYKQCDSSLFDGVACVNENESFLDQYQSEFTESFFENIDTNDCRTSCHCLILEPLLSVDSMEANIPSLEALLGKLNVFSILDPFDIVESSLNCLFEKEQLVIYSKTSESRDQKPKFEEVLSFRPYESATFELSGDFLDQPSNVSTQTMDASVDFLSHSMDMIPGSSQDCQADLVRFAEDVLDSHDSNKQWKKQLEKLEGNVENNDSTLNDMLNRSVVPLSDDFLTLQLPLVLDPCFGAKSPVEKAVDSFQLVAEQLPANDLNLMQPMLLRVEHLLSLEMLPSTSGNYFMQFFIPEFQVHSGDFNAESSHDSLEVVTSMLCVEPVSNSNQLDLSLPWNPVGHASVAMSCVSKSLQQESVCNDYWKDKRTSTFSEVFDSILNLSVDGYINSEVQSASMTCPDIPSVQSRPTTVTLPSNLKQADLRNGVSSKTTVPETKSDELHCIKETTSVKNTSLDPLSNFMVLMGKQKKNELPWSASYQHKGSADLEALSDTSVMKMDGKSMAVKRIRTAWQNNCSLEKTSTHPELNDTVPSKKMKNSFPTVQNTLNMVLCSEIVKKSKFTKIVQVNITDGRTLKGCKNRLKGLSM